MKSTKAFLNYLKDNVYNINSLYIILLFIIGNKT